MSIYYDATVHYGVVDNSAWKTAEFSESSLETVLRWLKDHWYHQLDFTKPIPEGIGPIMTGYVYNDDWSVDLYVVRRMVDLR